VEGKCGAIAGIASGGGSRPAGMIVGPGLAASRAASQQQAAQPQKQLRLHCPVPVSVPEARLLNSPPGSCFSYPVNLIINPGKKMPVMSQRVLLQLQAEKRRLERQNQLLRAKLGFKIFVSPFEVSRIMKVVDEDFCGVISQLSAAEVESGGKAEFVWVHGLTKDEEHLRDASIVCTQLSGIAVLEDKGNLAMLQQRMHAPMIDSFLVSSPREFKAWCEERFASSDKVWIVKDVGGTGGEDIWLFNAGSWKSVAEKLVAGRMYVIQHYISNPLLWKGTHKFHFRVYAVLTGDMQLFVYRKSFAHVANKPFSCECDSNGYFDNEVHITNVSQVTMVPVVTHIHINPSLASNTQTLIS
jgi:hypothetical protein